MLKLLCLLFLVPQLSQSLELDLHLDLEWNEETCLMSFHDVVNSVKSNHYNIESIDDGFFPPNAHPSFWVEVNYYFSTNTTFHGPILVHPAAFEAKGSVETPDLQFQWVETPIFHYFGPALVEALGGVFVGFSPARIDIVIDPICGNEWEKVWMILNKLTVKLQQLSSVENNKRNGFATLVSKDHSHYIPLKMADNNTVTEDTKYGSITINLIVIAQLILSISWMILVPVFLQKLQLLPFTQNVITDTGQLKCCMFWGFTIVTFLSMGILYAYDLFLFIMMTNKTTWIVTTGILFPVPAIYFTIFNIWFTYNSKIYIRFHIFAASVVLTLFLQELTFHIGWILLMLITFPARVGILCINVVGLYVAASLLLSGLLMAYTASRRARGKEIIGGSLMLIGTILLSFAYLATITIVGREYHDGLSAIMPTLMPIVIFGLLTWISGGFRSKMPAAERENTMLEVMLDQSTNGVARYFRAEFKELPI